MVHGFEWGGDWNRDGFFYTAYPVSIRELDTKNSEEWFLTLKEAYDHCKENHTHNLLLNIELNVGLIP